MSRLIDGVPLHAADREDVEAFKRMLQAGLADSPTLRQLLTDIGSDPGNAIQVELGRNQPGVYIDSFERNLVDLEDLERLPSAHDPDLEGNEVTREEQIVHVLAERRHASKMVARLRDLGKALAPVQLFNAAHEVGLAEENRYRAERGQTPVVDASSHAVRDAPDQSVIEYLLADGTSALIVTSHRGQIDRVLAPRLFRR